jgi:hypothetical protein
MDSLLILELCPKSENAVWWGRALNFDGCSVGWGEPMYLAPSALSSAHPSPTYTGPREPTPRHNQHAHRVLSARTSKTFAV